MQNENTDMAFITETWINKKEGFQLITSQLKCFSYNSITENRMPRKAGGLACIYKDDLTVEKIKTDNRPTFGLPSLKIKITSYKQPLAFIYRTPYSKKIINFQPIPLLKSSQI